MSLLYDGLTSSNFDETIYTFKIYSFLFTMNNSVYCIDVCSELPVSPSQLFLPKYTNTIKKNENQTYNNI